MVLCSRSPFYLSRKGRGWRKMPEAGQAQAGGPVFAMEHLGGVDGNRALQSSQEQRRRDGGGKRSGARAPAMHSGLREGDTGLARPGRRRLRLAPAGSAPGQLVPSKLGVCHPQPSARRPGHPCFLFPCLMGEATVFLGCCQAILQPYNPAHTGGIPAKVSLCRSRGTL